MNRIKYRISLDMFEVAAQTTIKAKKGDTACSIHITLTENGKIYNITDGCYAVFSAKKPNDDHIYNSDTCSIKDNVIIYDFTEQTASCEGVVECEVILFKDKQKLTSPRFNLVIDGTVYNGEGIVSTTSIDVFNQMVEEIKDRVADEIVGNGSTDAVSYSEEQDLTDEQKETARSNINAVDAGAVMYDYENESHSDERILSLGATRDYVTDWAMRDSVVNYESQSLSPEQKQIARENIGAISQTELDEAVGSVEEQLENKQDALVSGINIKTINGKSLLGDGDINIEGDQSGSTPDDVINLRSEIEKAIGTYIIPSEPEIVDTPRIDNKYYHVNTGEIVDGTFYGSQCTELIAVTEGDIYYITGEYGYLCALITEFDENKTYISSVGVNSNGRLIATDYEYIVPSGVAYVGFSTRSITNQALIVKVSFDSEVEFADVKGDIVNIKADIAKLENDVSNMENNSNIETIESLKADVQDIKTWGIASKNLYNPENDTFGNRADGSGNVSMGIRNSEWITVEPNSSYVLSNHGALGVVVNIALKDNDDSVISLGNNQIDTFGDYLITTEESTTHIRFSTYVPESNGLLSELMLEKGVRRTEYEPYKIILDYVNRLPKSMQNVWIGKKMAVDGDSITHDFDRNYWQFAVSKILGMWLDDKRKLSTEDNLFAGAEGYAGCGWRGIGGSTIADSYLLNAVYLNDLTLDIGSLTEEQIAEYEATYKTNEGDNYDRHRADTGIVLRYQNYPDDADIVLIAGGTNDWAHSVTKLGDFDSDDITTFNGALNTLLPGLKEKYPDIPIVMMTPIKRGTYGYVNKLGLTQEDFVDALIKKCRQYNVYCLDMWANCPINPNIKSMVNKFYTRPAANGGLDLVHPNAEGHLVMGKTVAGFIRTLN